MRTTTALVLVGVLASGAMAGQTAPTPELLAAYAQRAGTVASDDAEGWTRLGTWCRENGLGLEATGAFANALRANPDHAAARTALGYEKFQGRWMTEGEAKTAKGFVRWKDRWVLPAEREMLAKREAQELLGTGGKLPDAAALIETLGGTEPAKAAMAETALRGLPAIERLAALAEAVEKSTSAGARAAAARLLGEARDLGAIRALTRAAVCDADAGVRGAATSALQALRYRETPLFLGSALRAKAPEVREHAAESLGKFQGDAVAARVLAEYYIEGFAGSGPRVNFYQLNQLAYIRDFDVEVAQAATIGDPIVGRIEEGVVQDVRMVAGRMLVPKEAYALASAFERVTGKNLGTEAKAYGEWLRDQAAPRTK